MQGLRFAAPLLLASLGLASSASADDRAAQLGGQPAQASSDCPAPPISPIIRRDFNDIGWLLCPTPPSKAVGGQISATYNALTGQTSVSADAVAAFVVRYYGNHAPLLGVAIAPFVQADGTNTYQTSTSPSSTTQTWTPGGLMELGLKHLVPDDNFFAGESFFRVRDGEVFGPSGSGITSNSFVAEWLPTIPSLYFHYPIFHPLTELNARFDPGLMVQFDQLDTGPIKYLLFANHSSALRIGPQLGLWVDWVPPNTYPKPLKDFIKETFVTVTFHIDDDIYSGRGYSWAIATLTHNIDPEGNYAVSASYGYGNSETTGNLSEQIKLSFSGKF